MRMSHVLLVCALTGVLGLTGCLHRKLSPVYNPTTPIVSNQNITKNEVRNAILNACPITGWVPREISGNEIEATLYIRVHKAVVTITYDDNTYHIEYKESDNIAHKDGNIHPYYNGWIKNLDRNISTQLGITKK